VSFFHRYFYRGQLRGYYIEHGPGHYQYDVNSLFLGRGEQIITNSKESYEVRCFSLEAIGRYTSEESIMKMLDTLAGFVKNGE